MATQSAPTGGGEQPVKIPVMQQIMDNNFLLLFLGVVIPAVIYTLWGVMEVASVPLGK
jgi:hypothetical protein